MLLPVKDLISKAQIGYDFINLSQVVNIFRDVDPDFSATKYGYDKLLTFLESIPDILEIKKNESVCPPSYECRLKRTKNNKTKNDIHEKTQKNKVYKSLYKKFKNQPSEEIFAYFGWNEESGETWETPFKRLADMAKPEKWHFKNNAFKKNGQDFIILRQYLNYTFLRLQQQEKIAYSEDGNKACLNTGLMTPGEKDIYATFFRNRNAAELNQPEWVFYTFADSYSEKIKDFNPLPEVAAYITDSSDLIFDLSYDLEINAEHIVRENKSRLPDIFYGNERLAMTAIQGATKFLTEKIRRNYKLAIPHWYHNKIQLLLPLNLLNEDKPDLALVADKDPSRKIYRIKTVLTMDMAYIDARLICRPDIEWLNP